MSRVAIEVAIKEGGAIKEVATKEMDRLLKTNLSSRATRVLSAAKGTGSRGTCISAVAVSSVFRAFVFLALVTCAALALLAAPAQSNVQLNVARTGPREVEEQTAKSVTRDYAAAWQSMARALEENNPGALTDVWTGFARERLISAIDQQRQSGVSLRYVDRGHRLEGVFYSPEGSALELHDTAQLERQVLDGGAVIHSEQLTAHYVVVMTPTSDRWQVRVFQSVPGL